MRYINDDHVRMMGIPWRELIERLRSVLECRLRGDAAQPLKPYLRYGDRRNRIIAMPAYVGAPLHVAGLKWIASFPGNKSRGLPRAHSVTVLNEADTGRPAAVCNSALLSQIRTAAVTALTLEELLRARAAGEAARPLDALCFGWGPVGRLHARMLFELFGDRIGALAVHDPAGVDLTGIAPQHRHRVRAAPSWQEAYKSADVVLTCTVAPGRYIDLPPKPGALLLNVSLRDYRLEALDGAVDAIVVDDWEEVCREDTDIERLHLQRGLQRDKTIALDEAVCRGRWGAAAGGGTVLFCPMGLAAFDLAVADWYVRQAERAGIGLELPD
ncbi:2,3-diaminopropionate biosynthesis protein SbnB [Paenibacillus thermoaerophilus]|uniref:2,3-diaminopropionate biosynthesis protein SbnB n=1 Tax=Paenibacillus thermoaerophilus TaxID=1215385 RepID=A0ABW2UZJ4_9BACL|nr:2,3-diaminopropionate biosynthesis protein SbnB [Paenibacillus thermoaerophilus]TMV14357.1 2,3-diaminopropionate biosynthesis protein SbnB [Paenibacillus thermoaerophilus]